MPFRIDEIAGRRGRSLRLAVLLAGTALSSAALAGPTLPTGGSVAAGTATIGAPAGGALTVIQTSGKAIIDWTGFSIGQGGKVQFENGTGATLNRVSGASVSSIDGTLGATGSVYLINPNGVIVGKTGVVNTGGSFVASTLDVADSAFLAGGPLRFAGLSTASVVNLGQVGSLGGDVALIATTVSNAGALSAPQGSAALASGSVVVMTDGALDGGRFAVALPAAGGSVTNSGAIAAAVAELRANGGDVYALAGDTSGVIRATGVAAGGGRVFLIAEGGTLTANGVVEAKGADSSGGAIETSGAQVRLDGARIATGAGGAWLIDPVDLTIDSAAATAIANGLATAAVTVQTTANGASGSGTQAAGAGDITVAAPISWASANGLTLSAYRNVNINANLTDSQAAKVVLAADNSATGVGAVAFGTGASASIQNGEVDVFYNPVSYTDAATRSTQAYAGSNNPDTTANPYKAFVAGGATAKAYMLVNSLAQLEAINTELDGVYALNRDIDASSTAVTPFTIIADGSSAANHFTGALNGQGHAIDRLTLNAVAAYAGLFGFIDQGASVSNLGLTNVAITSSAGVSNGNNVNGSTVGAVAGYAYGTMDNVYVTGSVSGYSQVGGLVGAGYVNISNSHSDATVTGGGNSIGGLIGEADGIMTNDYATGAIHSGSGASGGLVGYLFGSISRSHATGAVTDGSGFGVGVGGLVGNINASASDDVVVDSYATGAVTGGYQETGGLIGEICCHITGISRVYATGAVTGGAGESYVGGLIGYAYNTLLTDAHAGGAVAATGRYAGGLIGDAEATTVTNAYATGAVSGTGDVGGLVGELVNSATLTGVYATGATTATGGAGSAVGGLVGSGQASASITNAYWDEGTTGQTAAVGGTTAVPQTAVTGIGGSTELDPYNASTYANFDLANTWYVFGAVMQNGAYTGGYMRPLLRSEYSTTVVNGHQLALMETALGATYTLGADIDLSETQNPSGVWKPSLGFYPVGYISAATGFYGTLNGAGHTIRNLTVIQSGLASDTGLIGQLASTGLVENITLSGGSVTGRDIVGALVGASAGRVQNASSNVAVNGSFNVGGLVGYDAATGIITGSSSSGAVTGVPDIAPDSTPHSIGGLVGINNGAIDASFATGTVTVPVNLGGASVGGLVGQNGGNSVSVGTDTFYTDMGGPNSITDSYATGAVNAPGATSVGGLTGISYASLSGVHATGAVSGLNAVGGLVGSLEYATSLSNAYASGDVTGAGSGVGGLVGEDFGSLNAVSASGAVTGLSDVGGLTGDSYGAGVTITGASATGPVTAPTAGSAGDYVGGLIGDLSGGAVTASSATGAVTGNGYVGGLVGYNGSAIVNNTTMVYATVSGSHATGKVSGVEDVGGLTGYVAGGSVADSYATGDVGGQFDVGGLLGYVASGSSVTGSAVGETYASGAVTGSGSAIGGFAGGAFGTLTLVAYTPTGAGVDGGTPGGGASEVGGLVGVNGGALSQVTSTGAVRGGAEVGGLVGDNNGGSITTGVASGAVTGAGYVGGLVGRNYAALASVSASGAVSGGGGTGGLVGVEESGSSITTATVTGAVNGVNGFGTGADVGGLVGANFGTVSGATVSGAVTGKDHTGGLVGYNSGAVTNGYASGPVIGEAYVGGLVGLNYAAVLSSGATGTVGGVDYVGGLVGWNASGGSARFSNAGGVVTATTAYLGDPTAPPGFYDNAGSGGYVGGLAGVNQGVLDSDVASAAAGVSGGKIVGGLVGLNQGTVSYASATTPVTGDQDVGGLVGWNDTAGAISKSYATGAVTGRAGGQDPTTQDDYVGGLVGVNFGSASDVYATGAVSGVQVVGGLVGTNMPGGSSITNAYATGAVSASRFIAGGFAGVQAGTVSDTYFQPSTTGQAGGVGYAVTPSAPVAIGPGTQYDAASQTTYQGFDFTNTWQAQPSAPPTLRARPM